MTVKIVNGILKYTLKSHNEIKLKLLNEIEESPHNNCDNKKDKIYRTDYYENIPLRDKKYFLSLYSYLENLFKEISYYYCSETCEITCAWFQQYIKNDEHKWHFHSLSDVSFVYFLELENSKQSTEFFDINLRKKFQIDVCEGDILVFPSIIPHRSPKIENNSRKTIISSNISLLEVFVEQIK